MKILHSADWHLNAPFLGFSEEERRFLQETQRKLPGMLAAACRSRECEMVLLAGDVFDTEPSADQFAAFCAAAEEMAVPVVIAPGNHDFCAPDSVWRRKNLPGNCVLFTGDVPERKEVCGIPVYGAAFHGAENDSFLKDFSAEGGIGVFHGDATQAKSPYAPVTGGQIENCGLKYLALGHIHKAGKIRKGRTLCAWPGCPMGRGWDETGDKGYLLVDYGADAEATFIPLAVPRFFDETVDVASWPDGVLPAAGSEDFYRITLTGHTEPLTEERLYVPNVPHLTVRDHTMPPLNIWEQAGKDSFAGTYFGMLKARAEEEQGDIAVLAAEISCRILAGEEIAL